VRAKERLKWDFPTKFWRAKKQKLTTLLQWAGTMQQGCPADANVSDWIWDLVTKTYKKWREGNDFTDTITNIAKRTKTWWKEQDANLSAKEIQQKVSVSSLNH